MREKYENIPADMKVREGIGREMLQVLEQRFPPKPGEDRGADNHIAACRGPHTRGGGYFLKEMQPISTLEQY